MIILLLPLTSLCQPLLKTSIGLSSPTGRFAEVNAGFQYNKCDMTVGYLYNPARFKSVYSIRTTYWIDNFGISAGYGITKVNQLTSTNYTNRYGEALIVGVEYNVLQVLNRTKLTAGMDFVGGDANVKVGIKIRY